MRQFLLSLSVVLCSCGILKTDYTTYYKENRLAGSTTHAVQVSKGIFKITNSKKKYYSFNSYSASKAEDMTRLLAAEVCYEEGYPSFVIPGSESYIESGKTAGQDVSIKESTSIENDDNKVSINRNYGGDFFSNTSRETTILINCSELVDSSEDTLVYDNELIIKSTAETYHLENHLKVRYPDIGN